MIRKLFIIAYYTAVENIRNKIYYTLLLFSLTVMGSSLFFSAISGEVHNRVVIDVGLGAIELFALLIAIFGSVRLVISEIENKTIYVILSKAIRRDIYILGKYFGIAGIILLNILIMFLGLIVLILIKGGEFNFWPVFVAIGFIFLKMLVVISLGLFISLVSTSYISSIAIISFLWILGHFGNEIKFLSERMNNTVGQILIKIAYYIIPNFYYFNFKDYLANNYFFSATNILCTLTYGLIYCLVLIYFSTLIFSRREL